MTPIETAIERIRGTDDLLIEIGEEFDPRDLIFLLTESDYHAVLVDRAPVFDRDTLMHALYQSLRFPAYFGFNWDSLKDCLTALKGMEDRKFILVFSDLSQLPRQVRSIFLEAVTEANEVRGQGDSIQIVSRKI